MALMTAGFVIAGKDRHFYPATLANEKGDTFAVSSPFVPEPEAVRYSWGVHPGGNFGNRAGDPACAKSYACLPVAIPSGGYTGL